MKKLLLASLMLAIFAFVAPVQAASWQDSVNAAINSGNMNQINVIAANNPGIAGELALFLMQKTQDKFKSNPDLAAKIFVAAQPFVAQIPGDKAKDAAALLRSIENEAKEANFQQKDCRGAVTILGAALNMSSLPNIVAASPNLHADILADANDSIEKNPTCDTKELQDEVNLAQQPTIPTVTLLGGIQPSSD